MLIGAGTILRDDVMRKKQWFDKFGMPFLQDRKLGNPARLALRLALVLAAFGLLWVSLSNEFLSELAPGKEELARYYTYVEWFYVLVTVLLVYFLVKRMLDRQAAIENELRSSEVQLRLFIEHAPVALAMLDREMRYLSVSQLWIATYDLAGKDIIGKSFDEVSSRIPDSWKLLLSRGLDGEVLQVVEDCMKKRDGSLLWLRCGIRPWYAGDGRVGGIVVFSEDVSRRKLAEEAMSESEKKYRILFENSRDALLVNSPPSWRFSAANHSALKMFGAKNETEFMVLTPRDISPEYQPDGISSAEKAQQMMEIALRDGSHFFEWIYKRLDGLTFPAEVLLTRMEWNGIAFLQGSLRDISARKEMEMDMLERHQEMEALQKSQVAAQTAAAFAHELNQPLSAISAYIEAALIMLQSAEPDPEQLRTAIEESKLQALRAGESIRNILAVLSMREFPVESFDLNKEVREIIAKAKTEQKLQFHSRLDLDPQLPLVQANRMHVQKVLLNLLHNSVEAMQEAYVPEPESYITVRTQRDENGALVTIRDNGPGFQEGGTPRLFEPFYTSRPAGIGMGLVISRSLIEANGGQLWVDAHEKPGATFHLTLPFAL